MTINSVDDRQTNQKNVANKIDDVPSVVVYKYSNDRKGPLHESIILAGVPIFIKYENGQIKAVQHIEEASRIIGSHRKEGYPYPPYEFTSMEEVHEFVNKAKITNIESLYHKAKEIVPKYIEQEEPIIIILAADIVWSYFQDLFPTTHYINVTGDNETGKSSIGYVFQFTGYRPVKASTISTANYYRTLGIVEPGQATIIEDEADNIEEDSNKLKTLKHTYEYNSRIPKVNMNTKDQNQNWFYGYCFKMIISEKPLNPFKAKGLVERTLTFHCKPATESIQSIKEVTANPPGHLKKQELYRELMDFRKLMLCYRLVHYMDHIPDIDTGLKNRDKELGGPLLQLFNNTKVFGEIKYALNKFLSQRKNRKQKTIESALQPLIGKLLKITNSSELFWEQIWNTILENIPGRLNPQNPDEFWSNEYGPVYRNTLSQKIVEAFRAVRKRKNNGTVLIFDEEKINELKEMYEDEVQNQDNARAAAPDANKELKKKDTNSIEVESVGCESSEGSRICGFIIE